MSVLITQEESDQCLNEYIKELKDKVNKLEKDKNSLVGHSRILIALLCRMCHIKGVCDRCIVACTEKSIEELLK